jgi:hypothetical protein
MKNILAEQLANIDNYQEKADFFLKQTKTTFSYKFAKVVKGYPNDNKDKEKRNSFKVTLKNEKASYTFNFYGSINDYQQRKQTLTSYNVLACLIKTEPNLSLEGFMREYGYEVGIESQSDYKRINKIHEAVLSEYANLKRLFSQSELEAMIEIY